ncbi:MAG TPA: hypothetical protein VMS18_25890 [Candidatus Binatia bacterium]|nr:hypothetical protein [Candidatus Binatia bacterium]
MIPPVNSPHGVDVKPVAVHPASEVKPDPEAQTRPVQKSGEVSQDQVTLRSAGEREG